MSSKLRSIVWSKVINNLAFRFDVLLRERKKYFGRLENKSRIFVRWIKELNSSVKLLYHFTTKYFHQLLVVTVIVKRKLRLIEVTYKNCSIIRSTTVHRFFSLLDSIRSLLSPRLWALRFHLLTFIANKERAITWRSMNKVGNSLKLHESIDFSRTLISSSLEEGDSGYKKRQIKLNSLNCSFRIFIREFRVFLIWSWRTVKRYKWNIKLKDFWEELKRYQRLRYPNISGIFTRIQLTRLTDSIRHLI